MSLYQCGMSLKALLENPELLQPPKKQDEGKNKEDSLEFDGNLFASQAAFLGPQLWDKTYDEDDLKLEFMDLDEFLSENSLTSGRPQPNSRQTSPQISPGGTISHSQLGALLQQPSPEIQTQQLSSGLISSEQLSPTAHSVVVNPNTLQQHSPQHSPGSLSPNVVVQQQHSPGSMSPNIAIPQHHSPVSDECSDIGSDTKQATKRPIKQELDMAEASSVAHDVAGVDFEPNADDLMLARLPGEDFDPRCRSFTAEELRPQPVIKKSRKVFVPDDLKDDKYWARRKKNNIAARRSRDARRTKENQIAMRALFLESSSDKLSDEVEKLIQENKDLRQRLAKYEPEVLDE